MKVKVKCPASCGELIQGIIGDSEKLISLPIDMYSEVTIEEARQEREELNKYKKKSKLALEKTLEFFKVPKDYINKLRLSIKSNIPIAKGMASSTADICGVITATTKLLGKKITKYDLAKLCCMIEPTDSTIFSELTLFDHINGRIIDSVDYKLDFKVIIMELDSIINTQEFRKINFDRIRRDNKEEIERAYRLLKEGCQTGDKSLIGKGVTISSLANQSIIKKPFLEEIIEISQNFGAYGVNVAHSGTVVGILYDEQLVDVDRLKAKLMTDKFIRRYVRIYSVNCTHGGVRIL